jgi:hypothetical protein
MRNPTRVTGLGKIGGGVGAGDHLPFGFSALAMSVTLTPANR